MKTIKQKEKLSLSDFENFNASNSRRKIPEWLSGRKPVSATSMRIMMLLFFLAVGYVAASAGSIEPSFSNKNIIAAFICVLNFFLGFFLNQTLFVPKFFFKRKFVLFAFVNVLFLVESSLVQDLFILWVSGSWGPLLGSFYRIDSVGRALFLFLIFFIITLIVCTFNVLFRLGGLHAQEVFQKRIQENFYLQADLAFLKQQLSSHFLFNTLNNITALVDIDPKLAQKSMIRLSSVLRQMLHESKEENVSLETELDILQKYCELEKLRFGPNMQFSFTTDVKDPEKQVAPLLMMPLIENAIKYGMHPSAPCRIEIAIFEQNDVLKCHVENTIAPKTASTQVKSGIGLSNLKRRLEVCYPGKYLYKADNSAGIYTADLHIELNGFQTPSVKDFSIYKN